MHFLYFFVCSISNFKILFNYFSEICPLGVNHAPVGDREDGDVWVDLSVKYFRKIS